MSEMKTATLNKGKEKKYLNHYPLIDEADLYAHDHLKEGDIFQLVTDSGNYIAKLTSVINIKDSDGC